MKTVFDKNYKRYDEWYDKNRFVYLSELDTLKKALPKKGKGLEIGVGTGRFASKLGIPYGIDPSANMLKIAGKRGINVQVARGEELPFEDSTFDYVVITITLCFVKNPRRVLIEARRVLRKGGKILIGIVDRDSFLGKYYREEKKSIFYKHATFFGIEELTDLLSSLQFNRFSYYQTLYDIPEKIDSVQKIKKGFGEGGFVVIKACKSKL
jgi:ubiquinone/menaquinone biosynthesis C-methylase UbiE